MRNMLGNKRPIPAPPAQIQCGWVSRTATKLIKRSVLLKSSRWKHNVQAAGCGSQALHNLRQSLKSVAKFKTKRLRGILERINSKGVKSYGELALLYKRMT